MSRAPGTNYNLKPENMNGNGSHANAYTEGGEQYSTEGARQRQQSLEEEAADREGPRRRRRRKYPDGAVGTGIDEPTTNGGYAGENGDHHRDKRNAVPPLDSVQGSSTTASTQGSPASGSMAQRDSHHVVEQPKDPHGLLGNRVRVYWPLDDAWYRGRITNYSEQEDMHFVLYDDGDKKWYYLPSRQFILEKGYKDEVVDKTALILVHQHKWENMTIHDYDAAVGKHIVSIRGKKREICLDEFPVLWTAEPQLFLQDGKATDNMDITEHPDHGCFDAVYSPTPMSGTEYEKTLDITDCTYPLHSSNKSGLEEVPQSSLERLFSCTRTRSIAWQTLLGRRVYTLNRRRSSLDCGVIVSYEEQSGAVRIVYDHETVEHNIKELEFAFEGDTNYGSMAVPTNEFCGSPTGRLRRGLVGLENLQNTCYFNSILQCLAHTTPLATYLLSGLPFRAHLNMHRKFGLNARFAEAFAALLWNMWLGKRTCIAPVWIKSLLTEKDRVFHGVGQQDAHEALMAVVDALHEDMARKYRIPIETLDHENVITYSVDPHPSFCVWTVGDSCSNHKFSKIKECNEIPLSNGKRFYQFVMDIPSLRVPQETIELETSIIKQMFFLYTVVERQWDVLEPAKRGKDPKHSGSKSKRKEKSGLRSWLMKKVFRREKRSGQVENGQKSSLHESDQLGQQSNSGEAVVLTDEELLSDDLQLGPDDGELLPPLPVSSTVQPEAFSSYFARSLYSLFPTSQLSSHQVMEVKYSGEELRDIDSLEECLRAYFSPHITHKVENEEDKQKGEKRYRYGLAKTWLLPPLPLILIVQLNRFQCAPPSLDTNDVSDGNWRLLPSRSLNHSLSEYISPSGADDSGTAVGVGSEQNRPDTATASADSEKSKPTQTSKSQHHLNPRKLTHPISFPLGDLNLDEFVAPSPVRKGAWAKRIRKKLKESQQRDRVSEEGDNALQSYPIQVEDIEPHDEDTRYDCFGVVCHRGRMEGGHYIAYVRYGATQHLDDSSFLAPGWLRSRCGFSSNLGFPFELVEAIARGNAEHVHELRVDSGTLEERELHGTWYLVDDSFVEEVDRTEVEKEKTRSTAYVLFYARRSG
eukprot:gb/GECG01015001.1/.p1 GENE.gb/GECG01015001.1/~~gb/GECG01015001.1/.p1  ORF type:complete len:1090 (+),score=110.19 gb/GECG01015001.1/:1-3270(+)